MDILADRIVDGLLDDDALIHGEPDGLTVGNADLVRVAGGERKLGANLHRRCLSQRRCKRLGCCIGHARVDILGGGFGLVHSLRLAPRVRLGHRKPLAGGQPLSNAFPDGITSGVPEPDGLIVRVAYDLRKLHRVHNDHRIRFDSCNCEPHLLADHIVNGLSNGNALDRCEPDILTLRNVDLVIVAGGERKLGAILLWRCLGYGRCNHLGLRNNLKRGLGVQHGHCELLRDPVTEHDANFVNQHHGKRHRLVDAGRVPQ